MDEIRAKEQRNRQVPTVPRRQERIRHAHNQSQIVLNQVEHKQQKGRRLLQLLLRRLHAQRNRLKKRSLQMRHL